MQFKPAPRRYSCTELNPRSGQRQIDDPPFVHLALTTQDHGISKPDSNVPASITHIVCSQHPLPVTYGRQFQAMRVPRGRQGKRLESERSIQETGLRSRAMRSFLLSEH